MPTIKRGTQLYETSNEDLNQLAADKGPVPLSPSMARAIGANKDQAKMAGSREQKEAVFKELLKPEDTLSRAKRLEGPREIATPAEEAQRQKASTLANLKKFDTSVQSAIEKHLSNISSKPSMKLSVDRVSEIEKNEEKRKSLETDLTNYVTYSQSGNTAEANKILERLGETYSMKPEQIISTFLSPELAIEEAGAEAAKGELTLGQIGAEALGFSAEELVSLIGTDWDSLTVPQMQQRVEELQAQEFSRASTLQAQLKSLPIGSAEREAIWRELQGLAQVGVWGTEQDIDDLVAQMDSASTVDIAGEQFEITDILQSDTLSELIRRYLDPNEDETFKTALESQLSGFTEWIQNNVGSLQQIVKDMETAGMSFDELQETAKNLNKVDGVDETLNATVMSFLTGEDWAGVEAGTNLLSSLPSMAGNPVFDILAGTTATTLSAEEKDLFVSDLNRLTTTQLNAIKELKTTEAVKKAWTTSKDLLEQEELLGVMGLTPDKVPIFATETLMNDYEKYKPVVSAIVKKDQSLFGGDLGKTLVKLIKDGDINSSNVEQFLKDPNVLQEYVDYNKTMDTFSNINESDTQSILNYIFNEGDPSKPTKNSVKSLNTEFQLLSDLATIGGAGSEADKQYKEFASIFDKNSDGKIDNEDISLLHKDITTQVTTNGKTKTISDIISGGDNWLNEMFDRYVTRAMPVDVASNPELNEAFNIHTDIMSTAGYDGKIDINELDKLGEDSPLLNKLLDDPTLWNKYVTGVTPAGYQAHVDTVATTELFKLVKDSVGDGGLKYWHNLLNSGNVNVTDMEEIKKLVPTLDDFLSQTTNPAAKKALQDEIDTLNREIESAGRTIAERIIINSGFGSMDSLRKDIEDIQNGSAYNRPQIWWDTFRGYLSRIQAAYDDPNVPEEAKGHLNWILEHVRNVLSLKSNKKNKTRG